LFAIRGLVRPVRGVHLSLKNRHGEASADAAKKSIGALTPPDVDDQADDPDNDPVHHPLLPCGRPCGVAGASLGVIHRLITFWKRSWSIPKAKPLARRSTRVASRARGRQ